MPQSDKTGSLVTDSRVTGNTVVDLGERMRASWCAPLRQMEGYWSALRRGRVVPARSDVEPRGIEGALAFAFVAELLAPGHARMRIAGTHLCDLMGMEVRGMPLSAMFSPVAREALAKTLSDVFNTPARADFELTAERRLGKPDLKARMMLLPMTDDFGDVSRILGCLVSDGTIGRAPRRFEIVQADTTPLTAETTQTISYPSAQPKKVELAEAPRPFLRPSSVPYLQVVDNQTD